MDKNTPDINNSGYTIKTEQDADYVINLLKSQLKHYKLKNVQNDKILTKLKLTPESLSFSSRDTLNLLTKLQDASKVNKLDSLDVEMSYLDNATSKIRFQKESAKLKLQFENLSDLNDTVIKDCATTERDFNYTKAQMDHLLPITQFELQKMQLSISSYEEKIKQYIDKYPWLNDPEYNLLHIQEEIKKVYRLNEDLDKLKGETEIYHGLKPDLFTAKTQLTQIKTEYNKICKMIADNETANS